MSDRVNLFFAGDFCSKPSTTNINVSGELRDIIQSCEIKVVNFEVPLKPDITLPPQQYERFWQNDDVPVFLKDLGFNLFSIANNHAFDWGIEGYKKTKAALGEASFGAGAYDEAYRIKVREINGIKIGFLALSYAAYTGVFDDVLHHDGLGCAYINDLRVNHDILEAKKKVDYLFVLPHDGIEYIDVPLPETIARYRDFIDYGADGVIGSHPHCPQGWEEYKGKPIFYSLGNFCLNPVEKRERPFLKYGLAVSVKIENGEIQSKVYYTKYDFETRTVGLTNDDFIVNHLEKVNQTMTNRQAYLKEVDAYCARVLDEFSVFFAKAGYYEYETLRFVKQLVRKMIGKRERPNPNYLLHLMRCESHRWAILRGLEKRGEKNLL